MRSRVVAHALLVGLIVAVVPMPALARGAPETLAATKALGNLAGRGPAVVAPFAIDYLGVSWLEGEEPSVRFLVDGSWTKWHEAHEDDVPVVEGRTYSHLLTASRARGYQVRGEATGLKVVAINTTDGPRPLEWAQPEAEASHLAQPGVISRGGWGADESYRFNSDGTEKWTPAFYTTQKLVVHHTATKNDDPDPAATVRAIYRYHAIDKGWGDIGYNFLVDEQGTVYKGRYSGPANTWYEDTLTGENGDGLGVTAAHVGGYNSGTMGIAVLGTYRGAKKLPTAARASVVDHLAWESERHGLDPHGTSTFVNPVNGAKKENMPNISGHRDWASTQCPGDNFYAEIPTIRDEVAVKLSSGGSADTIAPEAPTNLVATAGDGAVSLDWDDNSEADVDGYKVYRSTDGTTWTEIAQTTGSSYPDSGLTNDITYSYKVRAFDTSGNLSGDSNIDSATPTAGTSSGTLHVHDLDGSGTSVKGQWFATVSIFVHDGTSAVADATVSYAWSAGSQSTTVCKTDGSGWCTVASDTFSKGTVKSVDLTVDGISHATLTYGGSASNHDGDGDSDGTRITVTKPN